MNDPMGWNIFCGSYHIKGRRLVTTWVWACEARGSYPQDVQATLKSHRHSCVNNLVEQIGDVDPIPV